MADANALKDQGNKAFAAKQYDQAIELFSRAIALDPKNHVLWSNRSAAQCGKRQWADALEDAEETVKLNPAWGKGYARKGAALHGARRYDEAIAAYNDGLKVEPGSAALTKGLREVEHAKSADADASAESGLGSMFRDPNMLAKLAANPKTASLLADRDFVAKLQALQTSRSLPADALSDPRMIQVLGALMGVDMQAFERPEGSDELPPGIVPDTSAPVYEPPSASQPATEPTPKKAPEPEPEPEPMEVEEDDEAKAKKEAEEEKAKGSSAYRARNFADAITHFSKAWETWPKDITYLTNLAAAYFEQGDYDDCIKACEKAVDEGREIRADYKLVAKAFGRIGTAYSRKGDMDNAVKFYQKSLAEHRTADILTKLRQAEKDKEESAKKAYLNPELAAKAREEGNTFFKAGNFVDSVKAYSEAIKRDPSDPRGYNNRAAAYTKLAALPEALKDADEAIKVDPKFVRAYIRKSMVLFGMKEYTRAMEAAQLAADLDEKKEHTKEIEGQLQKIAAATYTQRASETEEETLQRAMRDPEVASIMTDPVIQSILQQAQQDPAALQDHLKNPTVRAKIQKLIAAGIIKTR